MKIDKQKFIEAISYLREINNADFDSLDFSEFGPKDFNEISAEDFKYTGLNNKDYITMSWKV